MIIWNQSIVLLVNVINHLIIMVVQTAQNIIVAMGSVCETILETVEYLNSQGLNYGVIVVHLYRPFSLVNIY